MCARQTTKDLVRDLTPSLERRFGEHALVHFPDGDLVLVAFSNKVVHHVVSQTTIGGLVITCVLVEPGTAKPFRERGLISSSGCSSELSCLISIADLYYGIWREYDSDPRCHIDQVGGQLTHD